MSFRRPAALTIGVWRAEDARLQLLTLARYNASMSEQVKIGRASIIHADCFAWLAGQAADTIHAVVTDPPYGVKEYDADQLEKRANGKGGIWRIPPSFDGHTRARFPASRP